MSTITDRQASYIDTLRHKVLGSISRTSLPLVHLADHSTGYNETTDILTETSCTPSVAKLAESIRKVAGEISTEAEAHGVFGITWLAPIVNRQIVKLGEAEVDAIAAAAATAVPALLNRIASDLDSDTSALTAAEASALIDRLN